MFISEQFIFESLKQVGDRWAIVSREGKPLKYWDYKPTPEEVRKEERRIQFFKQRV